MKKILAIDDSKPNLDLIKYAFKRNIEDCKVLIAFSGKEGIDIANKEIPDTILLDISMPKMDGYEVCKKLKENEVTRHIPIILISAYVNDSDSIIKGLNMGADAFITKPINLDELSAQVKVMLRIKQAEDNLKNEIEKYRVMTDTLPDAVITVNLDEKIVFASLIALKLFGIQSYSEIIGRNVCDLFINEDRIFAQSALAEVLINGIIKDLECRLVKDDGTEFTCELSASMIKNNRNKPSEFIIVIKDISDRKIAENKILNYQKKLKTLNSVLTISEEKERRKIAEYLHDSLGQTLSIANMKLTSLTKKVTSPSIKKNIIESSELIQEVISTSRSLTYELCPPILYESGLIAAIKWKLDLIMDKYGINTQLTSCETFLHINDDVRILLYRIISELIANTLKHANPNYIKIEIRKDHDVICIIIKDNGIGYNYQSTSNNIYHSGFGLFSINERLESIQGSIVIESKSGGETITIVSVPYNKKLDYVNKNTNCRRS